MLTQFRHLLGRSTSAAELVARLLDAIATRWPRDGDEVVDLARVHAEVLAEIFQCGPATGPLDQGSDRPSRRAAAAEAYFAPETWWPEPPPEATSEPAARAERHRQARYALAYAILESAIRERPPANLLTRLTGRMTLLLTDPYHDGRAPWERHDRPDLTTCLIWLAAIPGNEALALIGRVVDGAYNTGPHHPPPGVAAEPAHSYVLYAHALHDALPACLARLATAGQLDPNRLHRARRRFPRLLEAASEPPARNALFHAVGPVGATILATWVEQAARELAQEITPATLPVLKQLRQVRGLWCLEAVAGHLRRWGLDFLPATTTRHGDSLASGLVHLLQIAHPAEGEDPDSTANRLRALGEPTLLALLPLTPGYQTHLLTALDWPGAPELVALIERVTGLEGDRVAPGQRVRQGPRPGVVEPAALTRAVRRLGVDRLRHLLYTYQQQAPAAGDALLLIEALVGTGAERVREGVARRRLAALAALGLLPLEGHADLQERYRILTGLIESPPGASPERQRLERAAAQAGLLNLAATAGHGDLARLAWALDETTTDDLTIGQRWTLDDRHHLRLLFDGGRPLLLTEREGTILREPPPAVRAHPSFSAYTRAWPRCGPRPIAIGARSTRCWSMARGCIRLTWRG